tara:strand:- start:1074 stop:1652 length:579 start_codon:yes stop_codon:yes gene_type:complete
MVSTTGQLDAPLVDIGLIQREYWERKTIELPSLAKFQQKKGIKGWFQKKQVPVCVIRRLSNSEWDSINERFVDLRTELAEDAYILNEIMAKMMNDLRDVTQDEKKILAAATTKAMPIYIAMLELMIEEPKMQYADVQAMLDVCDQHDRDNLMAQVNTLTSEKMSVAQAVASERMKEVNDLRTNMMGEMRRGR